MKRIGKYDKQYHELHCVKLAVAGVVSNQLVKGPGSTGASVTWGLKGGGKGMGFHYHIHRYNWYKPHTWFKNTPIIKP
ncbi:MAG: hypothetical protein H6587_01695 [Flavobacteriales bacterium]|nr:hypothetical protein [Flavobacteriales bacterium]MCB9363258.1 hypothetical protein [Flavobacteriales bacterium]